MNAPVAHRILHQTFWLHAHRALFWEEQRALILSDLHFGKTGHFRKAGIAVPQSVYKEDLQRLVSLVQFFAPKQIIAVGDLFHSHANREGELFTRWRKDFEPLSFHLVRGNHDILSPEWYAAAGITLWPQQYQIGDIAFSHDPCVERGAPFTFCGHLHPGITIQGPGRQSLRFPCFYFTPSQCILPAFSKFTGLAPVQPQKQDRIFAIVENSVLPIR